MQAVQQMLKAFMQWDNKMHLRLMQLLRQHHGHALAVMLTAVISAQAAVNQILMLNGHALAALRIKVISALIAEKQKHNLYTLINRGTKQIVPLFFLHTLCTKIIIIFI